MAWKLSSIIPKTISLPFNPSASRNILKATQHDILAAIAAAKPANLARLQPREEWCKHRAAAAKAAAKPALKPAAAPTNVAMPAGSALLQMSKAFPAVGLLGYLVQAVALAAASAVHLRERATRFGTCAETLEQALLHASDVDDAVITPLASLLQEGVVQLHKLAAPPEPPPAAVAAGATSAATAPATAPVEVPPAPDLDAIGAALDDLQSQLKSRVLQLAVGGKIDARVFDTSADEVVLAQARSALESGRAVPVASEAHGEVAAQRGAVVQQAAEQMGVLATKGNMAPDRFLELFPLPPSEAERLVAVEQSHLADVHASPRPRRRALTRPTYTRLAHRALPRYRLACRLPIRVP